VNATPIGPPATRASVGLDTPTLAPPGYLPPSADVAAALDPLRVGPETARRQRLEDRIAHRQAIGKPTGRAERRLNRLENNPNYLRPAG